MADRGIMFSGLMIFALLEGKKTQTRRLNRNPEKTSHLYKVGDRLYVREAWATLKVLDSVSPGNIFDKDLSVTPIYYVAGGGMSFAGTHTWGRMRASMHMPRWASRMTLLVTDVRIQRLHEIDEVDAKAEGVDPKLFGAEHGKEYTRAYIALWDELNEDRAKWSTNPFVVAYTFSVERKNIDA